jgi:hypothetical protein
MATQAEIDLIVQHYQDLLLEQYVNAPRARATVGVLTQNAIVDVVEKEIEQAFNLETATGPQLDVLGEYIGFSRRIATVIDRYYFTLRLYDTPAVGEAGYTDYIDPAINAGSNFYLYQYANTSFTDLDDDTYRALLKLKIILNESLNTMADISAALWASFGSDLICLDNLNMSILYLINSSQTNLAKIAIDAGLLPKPMGVRISGVFAIPDTTAIFGFVDYEFDNGNSWGFSTYESGWNGYYMLIYEDRIL